MVKKFAGSTFLVVLALLSFLNAQAIAAEVNPNGFPAGPHYNLNIIGKETGFTCPA
ncbi:MAG: hypothetical protein AB1847_14765 [bacterium]